MSRFPVRIKTGAEARTALLKGINTVADAVSATLGPKANNVAINQANGAPKIIHDGVSVAKSIDLEDEFEDMGAQLLSEVAIKTNETAGDGTTTATVLAQELCNKGNELITAGINPMILKAELEEALVFAVSEIKKLSQDVKNKKEVEKVATVSSADPTIGAIVADVLEKIGENGIIDIEYGNSVTTEVEYKEGMGIDRGYKSPYFKTNEETVEAVIEEPYILITNKKVSRQHELVPFIQNFLNWNVGRNLVIFGEVEEEALALLVVNKLKGVLNVVAIQPPAYGDRMTDELEDIATLTGGVVITLDSGRKLDSVTLEELGRADKVRSDRDKSSILGGKGDKTMIADRMQKLEEQIKIANHEYDAGIKRQRLAKLSGGVAVIRVGAINEVELADKKERVIDAVSAARSSKQEGIVAGGQASYLAISRLDNWPSTIGAKLLREAIRKPFKVLMEHSGIDYAEAISKINTVSYPMGIDVTDAQVKDLIKSGIVDPTKVERSALENAVSIAGMCFTTKVLISEPYKGVETK